jgi:hypothetical protein
LLYAAITGAEAVRVARREGLRMIPVVWTIFPTIHIAHGVGFAAGLIRYGLRPDWTEPERLPRRQQPAPATPRQSRVRSVTPGSER